VAAAGFLVLGCAVSAFVARPGQQRAAPSGDILPVLLKASDYLAGYVKALSSVVSEEHYHQVLTRKGDSRSAGNRVLRTLQSDYLLVAVSGSGGWMPFRDVYAVDGEAIRDRSERLLKLFVEAPPDAYVQALRIREASSRYNIGIGSRDTNVPTFALQVLTGEWRSGFSFRLAGQERVDETDAAVVEYHETASPTLIAGQFGEDVPSSGRFWIDPSDGRVLRTLLETRPFGGVNTIEVRFRFEPALGLLVPAEMIERRRADWETLEGRATYSNFRRFRVDTSIEIK
jgi:hypothetical protein